MIKMIISIFHFLLFFVALTVGEGAILSLKIGYAQPVQVGAEVMLNSIGHISYLKSKRVGILINSSSWVKQRHIIDILLDLDIPIKTIFAPEHGIGGNYEPGEQIENNTDTKTKLPVFSLYGKTKKPTLSMLKDIDLLLFDIQDVGARFYTYYSTLGLILEAAAEFDIEVWILDRPNPAGGTYIAGWVTKKKSTSFLSPYPIPIAHGMTLGELSYMMVGENWLSLPILPNGTKKKPNFKVLPMKGWKRIMRWPETQLKWHPPSPNLPHFTNAFLYLGTCLVEGTTLSEGRGTQQPFLWVGAPNFQWDETKMNSLQEQFGFKLSHITFTPKPIKGKSSNPKYKYMLSHGVYIQLNPNPNWEKLDPVGFGVALLNTLIELTPEATYTPFIYKLAGTTNLSNTDWKNEVETFQALRKPYLIYH